jgi:exodeoxyribonuclease VII large subunit
MRTYTVAVTDLLTESPVKRAISVSELNRQAKTLLEQGIARIWVEGEISNLARPASGHLYFSLKDQSAQIRCAFFRQRQRGPTINLKNGDQMLAFGKVSIYEARGDYQLIVEQLEEAGEGELRRRFEELKKKLASEGLFDADRKQLLPDLPAKIGVVTSPSGAAIRDIVTVLARRFPAIPVVIYPASVQGDAAAAQIASAIATAVRRNECDVLIVGRGGGSLEDLWPFNEEIVARAIADCPIPVVSAVGHEVDITIADFVADVRAPTPSGAAEMVVPDQAEWQRQLESTSRRIAMLGRRYLEDRYQSVDWLGRRLAQSSPAATVARQREWLRNLRQVMTGAIRHDLVHRARGIEAARSKLLQRSPAIAVQQSIRRLDGLQQRLGTAGTASVAQLQHKLSLAARSLDSVSPLATLERGYSIVSDAETGMILTDSSQVTTGASIRARLRHGQVEATVTATSDGDAHED